jgi:DNA-binding PadR family transcriptional regulator
MAKKPVPQARRRVHVRLTDLEGAAMAEIARSGEATSYAVARSFANSPSEFWSGSVGAVYPLIQRLARRKLLAASAGSTGKRARTDYCLTRAGQAALRDWLLDTERAAGLGFDPLRIRLVHLDQVSRSERQAFLKGVNERVQAFAEREVWPEDPRLRAIHATVVAARLGWIAAVSAVVEDHE